MLINAFVGGMVGMERSILPQLAEAEFGIAATSAVLSFIVAFGLVKATANLFTGGLADRLGRKKLLLLGWLLGLPVPFLLMWASSWGWVVAANVLLGIHQGFAVGWQASMDCGPTRFTLAWCCRWLVSYSVVQHLRGIGD